MREYLLKNGKTVELRHPKEDDAEPLVNLLRAADTESRFLAREDGEFDFTVEQEREYLHRLAGDPDCAWFLAVYEGQIVGQCSVSRVSARKRMRHRAVLGFVLLKKVWGLGIGGRMMSVCLEWAKCHEVEQLELEVVCENKRALRMYQGFGFEVVGTLKHGFRYQDGSYADFYQMQCMIG